MDKFTEAANKINKIKNKYHKLHPEVKQEYFKVYDEDITEEKKYYKQLFKRNFF